MEVQELLTRYQAGIRKFLWADLKNADLADADLQGINLSQARLNGANLTGANLTKANFYKADLSGANLLGADLTDANLRKAIFEGTIMPDGSSYEEWAADVEADVADEVSEEEEDGDSGAEVSEKEGIAFVSSFKREPQRPTRVKPQYFWKKLPKKRLLVLVFGYCCLGQMLTYFNAPLAAWLLAFLSSIIWVANESWFWFIPIVAAFAVIGTAGISVVALAVTFVVTFAYISGGVGIFKKRKLIRDGLWLGGILLCVFFMMSLLISSSLIFSGHFPLALLFGVGVAGVSYGMFAFGEMEGIGYSKTQIINVFLTATAAGLLLGWLVEMAF